MWTAARTDKFGGISGEKKKVAQHTLVLFLMIIMGPLSTYKQRFKIIAIKTTYKLQVYTER